jgi:predicted metal-binding membrane protein
MGAAEVRSYHTKWACFGPQSSFVKTAVEAVLGRPSLTLIVLVLVLPLACWAWVVAMARDMYGPMTGASAWMMTVTWDTQRLLLLWAMWAAMMAGMMLPTITPLLMLYARAARHRPDITNPSQRIYAMASGYVLVWAFFSIGATVLQRAMSSASLLTMMMEPSSPRAAAALLLIAGVYQLTPLKAACLRGCRSPITALAERWREGTAGAFQMGVAHGLYCLGCCWALMLLLFAGGVMNLTIIVGLTLFLLLEKLMPSAMQGGRFSGVVLLVAGSYMMAAPYVVAGL